MRFASNSCVALPASARISAVLLTAMNRPPRMANA
jgi:hypothetical protein